MALSGPPGKDRIVSHMNADHHDSLVRYLEYYCRLPIQTASSARLEDISLDRLILTNATSRFVVTIEPPMTALSEARLRLVAMDEDATQGLGRSKIVIDSYDPPKGFHLFIFLLCLLTWVLTASPGHFGPDSLIGEKLLRRNDTLMKFFSAAQPRILGFMIVIHVAELVWFIPSKLRKYNVRLFGVVWFLWAFSVFIEGYGATQRFNGLVRGKTSQKVKH